MYRPRAQRDTTAICLCPRRTSEFQRLKLTFVAGQTLGPSDFVVGHPAGAAAAAMWVKLRLPRERERADVTELEVERIRLGELSLFVRSALSPSNSCLPPASTQNEVNFSSSFSHSLFFAYYFVLGQVMVSETPPTTLFESAM